MKQIDTDRSREMRLKSINNGLLTCTLGALLSIPMSHGDDRYLDNSYYSDGVVTPSL